jgi:hypothetical protein
VPADRFRRFRGLRKWRLGGHFAWLPKATGAAADMMKSALDHEGLTAD